VPAGCGSVTFTCTSFTSIKLWWIVIEVLHHHLELCHFQAEGGKREEGRDGVREETKGGMKDGWREWGGKGDSGKGGEGGRGKEGMQKENTKLLCILPRHDATPNTPRHHPPHAMTTHPQIPWPLLMDHDIIPPHTMRSYPYIP